MDCVILQRDDACLEIVTWSEIWSGSDFGTWIWSDSYSWSEIWSRSENESEIWIGIWSERIWRTWSWSVTWIVLGCVTDCVKDSLGCCCVCLVPFSASLSFWPGRTRTDHSVPNPHCFWVCRGTAGCKTPPPRPADVHWEALGAADGCLWGPEAYNHDLQASQAAP